MTRWQKRLLLLVAVSVVAAGVTLAGVASSAPSPTPAPAQPVLVTNTSEEAVPVAVAGSVTVTRAIEPFQQTSSWDDWDGKAARNVVIDVPEGKMLVLEYVSVSATVPAGQKVIADVFTQGVGGVAEHAFEMVNHGTFGANDRYRGGAPVRAYAAGQDSVFVTAIRNSESGNGGRVQFAVSGYLVDR